MKGGWPRAGPPVVKFRKLKNVSKGPRLTTPSLHSVRPAEEGRYPWSAGHAGGDLLQAVGGSHRPAAPTEVGRTHAQVLRAVGRSSDACSATHQRATVRAHTTSRGGTKPLVGWHMWARPVCHARRSKGAMHRSPVEVEKDKIGNVFKDIF